MRDSGRGDNYGVNLINQFFDAGKPKAVVFVCHRGGPGGVLVDHADQFGIGQAGEDSEMVFSERSSANDGEPDTLLRIRHGSCSIVSHCASVIDRVESTQEI